KNISTSFFDLDLGFANYIDNSESRYYIMNNQLLPQNNTAIFPGPPASNILKLNNLKSSNVNIWLVQQRVNLYQHKLNLKYGIGFEMFNFRFEESVSFRDEYPYINTESIDFRKNKLFVKYLTIPFQINYRPNPTSKKGFYAGIGLSAGYLLKARNKQISAERGKQKIGGTFNLNDWRTAAIGELGIGAVRLYGSYGFSNLFADDNPYGFDFNPFAIGIRFNKF
ncbi:MAG: outer membrane beta-barrel protein, partial [Sediminibacterium sp.]